MPRRWDSYGLEDRMKCELVGQAPSASPNACCFSAVSRVCRVSEHGTWRPQKPSKFLGTGSWEGRGYIGGERGRLYTYRYTVATRMSCIKMGSDESHFNVSWINCEGQSHKTVSTNHNLSEEKGEPKRNGAEALLLTSLTPYRWFTQAHDRVCEGAVLITSRQHWHHDACGEIRGCSVWLAVSTLALRWLLCCLTLVFCVTHASVDNGV